MICTWSIKRDPDMNVISQRFKYDLNMCQIWLKHVLDFIKNIIYVWFNHALNMIPTWFKYGSNIIWTRLKHDLSMLQVWSTGGKRKYIISNNDFVHTLLNLLVPIFNFIHKNHEHIWKPFFSIFVLPRKETLTDARDGDGEGRATNHKKTPRCQ